MSNDSRIDRELLMEQVIAYQNGDEDAFGIIYSMVGDRLFRYAMVMTGDRMEAEDLLQDTLVQIIRSIGSLQNPSAFMAWSVQIMRNVYSHKLRRTRDVVARDENDLEYLETIVDENESTHPDKAAEDESLGTIVQSEIDRLPEAQRVTILAYYYDEFSVREISDMMGVTENTTKSRLFAGRKAMKRGIERYEKRTGVRLHSVAPAPLIAVMVQQIFDKTAIDLDIVKQSVLQRVLETLRMTGHSLPTITAPQQPVSPQVSRPSMPEQVLQQQPATQPTPEHAPQQPATQPTPEQAPQQPATQPTPEHAPQQPTTQPTPNQAPQQPPTQPTPEHAPQQPTTQPTPNQAPQQPPTQPTPEQVPQQPISQPTSQPTGQQPASQPAPEHAPQQPSQPTGQQPGRPAVDQTPGRPAAPRSATPQPERWQSARPNKTPDSPSSHHAEPEHFTRPAGPDYTASPAEPDYTAGPAEPEHFTGPAEPEHFTGPAEPDYSEDPAEPDTGAHRGDPDRNRKAAARNRDRDKIGRNRKLASQARRAALNAKRALVLKILAGAAAVLGVFGLFGRFAGSHFGNHSGLLDGMDPAAVISDSDEIDPAAGISDYDGTDPSDPIGDLFETDLPALISDYSKAYLSVLYTYERDIRDYTWQYPPEDLFAEPDVEPQPAALKDIDGDGIPELFIMESTVADRPNWACADLHIFTYKNGAVRELHYDMPYPGEYSAEHYDDMFGHVWTDHHGRMVQYGTFEPSTAYTVFTGKDTGTLYILSLNYVSEETSYRMRKYSMRDSLRAGAEDSRLTVESEIFRTDGFEGSEYFSGASDPQVTLQSAIDDMGDMVIYGGLFQSSTYAIASRRDAEQKGWSGIWEESCKIGPEKFRDHLSMTYDEIVALLLGQVREGAGDPADGGAEKTGDPEAFIRLDRDDAIRQAGDTLFLYDMDRGILRYGSVGGTMDKAFDLSKANGSSSIYTDGKSLLYFGHDEGSGTDQLTRYDLSTGYPKNLQLFESTEDFNAAYYIGAVYDGVAYVGYSDGVGDPLWAVDLETGRVSELEEHGYISRRSGEYILLNARSTLSALDTMPVSICRLTGTGMETVTSLGDRVSVINDVIDGKFYYSVSADSNSEDIELYRCNANGSGTEALAHFQGSSGYNVSVDKYTATYCTVYLDGGRYRYYYKGDDLIPLSFY